MNQTVILVGGKGTRLAEFLVLRGDTMLPFALGRFEAWHAAAPGGSCS